MSALTQNPSSWMMLLSESNNEPRSVGNSALSAGTRTYISCVDVVRSPSNCTIVSELSANSVSVAANVVPDRMAALVAAAAAGTLAFMCGGSAATFDKARLILADMGKNIFHAGPAGAGQVAKGCNNMLLAIHMIGTCEALEMGARNGLDPAVLSEIMLASSGRNWSLEVYNPYPGVMPNAPASNAYKPGFMVDLMVKDLGLALEIAEQSDFDNPMGQLAQALYSQHQQAGNGQLDFSSILRKLQGAAGQS